MAIDYSKIAEAHRLIDELDGFAMQTIQEDNGFKFVVWGHKDYLRTSNIEEVLDLLYNAAKPWDRTFEKETEVWFLDCTMRDGVMCHGKIIKYSGIDDYVVQTDDGRQMTVPENCLYLSKRSLIEDCLEFWAARLAEYEESNPQFVLPKKHRLERGSDD